MSILFKICLIMQLFLLAFLLLILIANICLQIVHPKTFFLCLSAFIPFYCITSATLYLLIFVLPLSVVKNIEVHFFGILIIVGFRILCKKFNKT